MNKMILSIHKPCNQAWDTMTETEKGRFCNSCSKTIVDFTSMSDKQLINYFLEQKNQQVCGRVMTDQLDTVLSPAEPVRKRFGYWKYIAASALLFFTKASLKAQIKVDPSPQEHTSSLNKKDSVVFNAPQTLEEVKVTANTTHRDGRYTMMGAMSIVTIIRTTRRADTLRAIATSITGAAKIFPNPVARGNSFSLSLNLKAAGDYHIQIISASGALLKQEQADIRSLKSTHQIATDSRWSAGLYFVRITDEVHKEIATCKLVLN
jgi:hypothetical protein